MVRWMARSEYETRGQERGRRILEDGFVRNQEFLGEETENVGTLDRGKKEQNKGTTNRASARVKSCENTSLNISRFITYSFVGVFFLFLKAGKDHQAVV